MPCDVVNTHASKKLMSHAQCLDHCIASHFPCHHAVGAKICRPWLKCPQDLQALQVCQLQHEPGAVTVDSADDIAAGRIEVKLVEVVSTGRYRQQDHFSGAKGPSKSVDSKKLREGKKWFMAPELKVWDLGWFMCGHAYCIMINQTSHWCCSWPVWCAALCIVAIAAIF